VIAVEFVWLVEKVPVEGGYLVSAQAVGSCLRVGENGAVLRHRDYKVVIRVVHGDQSDVEVAFIAFACGIIPGSPRRANIVIPCH
jgi:hypothetical protein